jgi:hypothetical protein
MEKTLLNITMTDVGTEAYVHFEDSLERFAVAMSLASLLFKDDELIRMLAYIAEKNLLNPGEFEKKIVTVKGGIPWDNKPNQK